GWPKPSQSKIECGKEHGENTRTNQKGARTDLRFGCGRDNGDNFLIGDGVGGKHGYGRDKTVALSHHGFDEFGLIGVIPYSVPDLADGSIYAMLGVNENVIAPQLFNDLVTADYLVLSANQKNQELHGYLFELENTTVSAQLVGTQV